MGPGDNAAEVAGPPSPIGVGVGLAPLPGSHTEASPLEPPKVVEQHRLARPRQPRNSRLAPLLIHFIVGLQRSKTKARNEEEAKLASILAETIIAGTLFPHLVNYFLATSGQCL